MSQSEPQYNTLEGESVPVEFGATDPSAQVPDEDEIQGLVAGMASEAQLHRESTLDGFLEQATRYYNAEPFGGEDPDRSTIVIPVVRNAYRQTAPSLLRVFFGPEDVVEFAPNGEEDVALAEEQTEYINQIVIREDNRGFITFHSWFKDALIRRIGFVKWWWERTVSDQTETFEHVEGDEQLMALLVGLEDSPGIEYSAETVQTGMTDDGQPIYKVVVTETVTDGRARFSAVPPEEMIWSPTARDKYDARLVGHVRDVPADELISMGIDPEIVETHAGESRRLARGTELEDARQGGLSSGFSGSRRRDGATLFEMDVQDEATAPTQFAELYARVDVDGDGVGELRLFQCVGIDFEIVNRDEEGRLGEPVREIPFAMLSPDPEPHAFVGLGQSDSTMPLQRVSSYVTRGMLDSLAESIDPVTMVNPRHVNMKDAMSRKLSKVVRFNSASPDQAMHAFDRRWVGGDALPVLEYLDRVRETSVGMPNLAAGLEAKSLQSSTREGVRASVEGSQQQLELIARIFAETGVRELFKGLLGLMIEHKDDTRQRTVRLRGEYVTPDVNRWDPTMDVRVNVALGNGLVEDRLATLSTALETQMALMQAGAPIVSWPEIRETIARIMELSGHPDASRFVKPWSADDQQQFEQAQAEQGAQDPTMILAEIERQRVQIEAQESQAKLQLEAEKMKLEDDRERDKAAQDFALKGEELRAKYASEVSAQQLTAVTEHRRNEMDADLRAAEIAAQQAAAQQAAAAPAGEGV